MSRRCWRSKRAVNEGKLKAQQGYRGCSRGGASTLGLLALPLARRDLTAASMLYPGRVAPDALVEMSMAGEGDAFRHIGKINFVDNQVNPGTGSISIRGLFNNPKPAGGTYLMVPGMFVRVRLPIGEKTKHCSSPTRRSLPSRAARKCSSSMPTTRCRSAKSRSAPCKTTACASS